MVLYHCHHQAAHINTLLIDCLDIFKVMPEKVFMPDAPPKKQLTYAIYSSTFPFSNRYNLMTHEKRGRWEGQQGTFDKLAFEAM